MNKKKERPRYSMWQNTAFMVKEAWGTRRSVLVLCVLTAALAVTQNVAELLIAPVILEKVEATVPLKELLVTILVFAGILIVLAMLQKYLAENIMFGKIEVRTGIINKVNLKKMTTSFPNTENPAILKKFEKAQDATNGNDRASEAIWNTWSEILKNMAGFVVYLMLLSNMNGWMLVVILVTAIIGYLVTNRNQEWVYQQREEESGYEQKMSYISNHAGERKLAKDVRIFGMQSWLEDVYNSTLNLYDGFVLRREKVFIISDLVELVLNLLRNGIAYVYLINRVLQGNISAPEFLLYFSAVTGFTAWITGILAGFTELHKQSLELSNLREFLDVEESFQFAEGKELKGDAKKAYEIQLKNVSFRYPGAEKDTIHKLNLTIRPGENLAVVGLNGAGKTTLVKLICGFYDPTEGQVLLDGKDIREYNRRDYYRMFSAVFQQFSSMAVTIAENVTQCTGPVDMERVKDCIEKAGLTKKINSLPKGYETQLGREVYEDGIEFSGGEMQRLMLARALYKDAPIIVLDEPTAALDPIAENDIYLKYNEMTAGRTSIYISHRLASTRFCDRIIFVADGNILEEGTHEQLMQQNGKYAELYQVQSKYYQEGGEFHEE